MTESGAFKDHFSGHSAAYSAARPSYPRELFQAIAGVCHGRALAWDCATGNGQAAAGLAEHFDKVVATDASANQIDAASGARNVEFRVASAERSGLQPASADLATVAQALHWFDIDAFFGEVGRVLRPGGVLVYWCYGNCVIEGGAGPLVAEFYASLDDYWPPERRLIEAEYRDIQVPFQRITLPDFEMRLAWTARQLLEYVATWSACQRAAKATGEDPLRRLAPRIESCWGGGTRDVVWPLHVVAARRP